MHQNVSLCRYVDMSEKVFVWAWAIICVKVKALKLTENFICSFDLTFTVC